MSRPEAIDKRLHGKITAWDDDRGFGFIQPAGAGREIFFHISAIRGRGIRPGMDQAVTYEVSRDDQGRPCATRVALSGTSARGVPGLPRLLFSVIIAVTFLFAVHLATRAGKIPLPILWIYVVASALCFMAYGLDKSAARRGTWRTNESTLHVLSLMGGWPGAIVAQRLLRHKTRKQPFRALFLVTVAVNVALLAAMAAPFGQPFVQQHLEPLLAWLGNGFPALFEPIASWLKFELGAAR